MHEGNRKQVEGLMWNIINHFRVQGMIDQMTKEHRRYSTAASEGGVNEFLLDWVRKAVEPMPEIEVNNLSSDFQDGVVFNAILACKVPGSVDMAALEPVSCRLGLR